MKLWPNYITIILQSMIRELHGWNTKRVTDFHDSGSLQSSSVSPGAVVS
jgi:hypothetical protein